MSSATIVQPGRFTSIEAGVAIHIRERRPNGLLVGMLLDDRRNPAQRITIVAETRRDGRTTTTATSCCCRTAASSGTRPKQRDPNIVVFDRYAFDLSQFSGGAQVVKYSVRERYLWQLMFARSERSSSTSSSRASSAPNCMTACSAPIYPFAFVLIAFAFLGAPRTTRQSRALVDDRRHSAASRGLRLIGFASHRVRRELSDGAVAAVCRRSPSPMAASLFVDLARLDHRAAGFPDQRIADAASEWHRAPRRHDHEAGAMIGTLARYFGTALPHRADAGAARRVRAGHPARLHRADAPRQPTCRTCRRCWSPRFRCFACRRSPSASCRSAC